MRIERRADRPGEVGDWLASHVEDLALQHYVNRSVNASVEKEERLRNGCGHGLPIE